MYRNLLNQQIGTYAYITQGKVQNIDFAARQKSKDWRSYSSSEDFARGAGGGGQVGGTHPKPQTMPGTDLSRFTSFIKQSDSNSIELPLLDLPRSSDYETRANVRNQKTCYSNFTFLVRLPHL